VALHALQQHVLVGPTAASLADSGCAVLCCARLLQVKEYKEAAARLPAVLREAKELEGQQAKLQQALEQADGLRAAVEQLREQVCDLQLWHIPGRCLNVWWSEGSTTMHCMQYCWTHTVRNLALLADAV
jgi:hypothetical protein